MNVYLPYTAILPSEYQEVEYIQSNWNQYFIVWNSFSTDYITEAKFQYLSSSWNDHLFWVSQNSPNYRYAFGAWTQNFFTISWWSSWTGVGSLNYNINTVILNKSNISINWTSYSSSYSLGTINKWLWIFCYNADTLETHSGDRRLFYLKVYNQSSTVLYNLIPCYRKSDWVIGMYDLVNSVFYTNSWTGTFSKGNDVTMAELNNAYIGEVWTPWSNTIAYYPLTSSTTTTDQKWTYNLTNAWNVVFWTYQWVSCAYFNWTTTSQLYNTSLSFAARPTQTVLVWMYISWTSTSVYQTIYHTWITSKTGKLGSWFKYWTWLCIGSWYWWYESIKSWNINGSWHLLVNVTNWTSSTQYLDWALYQSLTNSLSDTQTWLYIWWAQQSSSERLSWYESEFIVESKVRTAQEILDYYNKTKSNYWL